MKKWREMTREEQQEAEANAFAIELLMPREILLKDIAKMAPKGIDLESDPVIAKLAKRYQVSEQLMTVRLVLLMELRG